MIPTRHQSQFCKRFDRRFDRLYKGLEKRKLGQLFDLFCGSKGSGEDEDGDGYCLMNLFRSLRVFSQF